jgi:peptidyl-prolyl cis-trans isomerase A (cyclophilin A)
MNRKLIALSLLFTAPLANAAPAFVELQTNVGTIAIQLNYQRAPITANNFIKYVNSGFYKNTIFHRVISGFMMQGGAFKPDGTQKSPIAPPIALESNNGLSNLAGTIAMARTDVPNSATSQFFINFANNNGTVKYNLNYINALNPGYAVFGKVIAGMNNVKAVENLPTFAAANKVAKQVGIPSGIGANTAFSDLVYTSKGSLIYIEAVYTSDIWQSTMSKTRILLSGIGQVISTPAGISCGSKCSMSQTKGTALSLTAKPGIGYRFFGWSGDCRGINPKIAVNTRTGNHNCTATFVKSS